MFIICGSNFYLWGKICWVLGWQLTNWLCFCMEPTLIARPGKGLICALPIHGLGRLGQKHNTKVGLEPLSRSLAKNGFEIFFFFPGLMWIWKFSFSFDEKDPVYNIWRWIIYILFYMSIFLAMSSLLELDGINILVSSWGQVTGVVEVGIVGVGGAIAFRTLVKVAHTCNGTDFFISISSNSSCYPNWTLYPCFCFFVFCFFKLWRWLMACLRTKDHLSYPENEIVTRIKYKR